jgi:hypothetical protein
LVDDGVALDVVAGRDGPDFVAVAASRPGLVSGRWVRLLGRGTWFDDRQPSLGLRRGRLGPGGRVGHGRLVYGGGVRKLGESVERTISSLSSSWWLRA